MIYFISDVHLGYGAKESYRKREEELLAVLDSISKDCEHLYIVGDLFDYWFEYNTVIPREFYRTLNALKELRLRGISIDYVMGNHDFGHQNFFQDELDIPIYRDDTEFIIKGKKFLLSHGDGKVYGDWGYLILKSILRNKFNIKLFQWLHPDIGIRLASHSSHVSRDSTSETELREPNGLTDFAKKKIIEDGYDVVVMGHQHKPLMLEVQENGHKGTYINLGDWLQHRTFACFDGVTIRHCKVDDYL